MIQDMVQGSELQSGGCFTLGDNFFINVPLSGCWRLEWSCCPGDNAGNSENANIPARLTGDKHQSQNDVHCSNAFLSNRSDRKCEYTWIYYETFNLQIISQKFSVDSFLQRLYNNAYSQQGSNYSGYSNSN